jgi:hypothetical protein
MFQLIRRHLNPFLSYRYGPLFGCSLRTTLTENGLLVVSFSKGFPHHYSGRALIAPSSISGEIDIMEARGNGPSYPAQYGPTHLFCFSISFLTAAIFAEASTMFEDR